MTTNGKLTKEQLDELGNAFLRTWDVIGGDVLQCMEQQGEEPVIKRDDVIEMCMEHVRSYGQIKDKEILKWLDTAGYDLITKSVKPYFKYARYGW